MVIAIAVKGLTAVDTSEVIDGLAVDRLWMVVPPGHAAGVRTESEYAEIDTIMTKKYGLSLDSIFRTIA